ncbi:glycosyltransferase family 1 protein [bacterium]|nr:MAG: glycosyltransferase family 1 protein [bacterium]
MRITIDARMIGFSGIGRYIQNLIGAISSIDSVNSYDIITGGINPEGSAPPGLNAKNFKYFSLSADVPIYSFKEQAVLPSVIRSIAPDIVHYPNFNASILSSKPSVVTIHDLIYYLFSDSCPGLAGQLYAKFMFNAVTRKAKKIIAVSEYSKQELVKHLGIKADKITVVYHGIDPVYAPVKDKKTLDEIIARYALNKDYVLYVGTHQPRKNLVRLIHAFSKVAFKNSSVDLLLTGKVETRWKELYGTAESLGLKDRVRFLGMVPEKDLPCLYSTAKLFAFPTLYEGFGIPPIEAAACGAPVMISDRTSLPEVAGDYAVVVNPEDVDEMAKAIERVLESKDLQEELRQKGLKSAKRFTWKEAALKTIKVYEEAAG